MKRILSTFFLTALALSLSSVAFSQGAASDTSGTKETPAQEKKEEKAEAKHHMAHKMATMPAVDINSASKEDLMKLPGITDELADKIVAARPYTSRMQLVSKKILTRAQYRKIRAKVTAKKM